MPNTFRTSTTAGATSTRERVERSELGQTVVHKLEMTYTCTTGDQAPPPFRPIIVLSQPGGQDAHPTMRMPMERTDAPRGRRPHPRPRPHPSPSASSSRHPVPNRAATRASSVVSYASGSRRSSIDETPDCCDPGPSSRRRSPRRVPRDRDCDPRRRYSASPPRRRDGDGSRPAIRINKMPSWKPSLNARKIRGTDFSTEWTESHGEGPVDTPPALLLKLALDPRERHRIPVGRLHVHIHNGGVQAWMYVARRARARARARRDDPESEPGPSRRHMQDDGGGDKRELGWRPAHKGSRHPCLRGYVLHFLDRGEPGFVRAATVKSYDAGRRKRQRIAQET